MNRWHLLFAVAAASLLVAAPQRGVAQEGGRGKSARVTVQLPLPGAELWFNGVRMGATGTNRTFPTPPLQPGQDYHYNVRARWYQDGALVDTFRTVPVAAGQDTRVDFTGVLDRATTRVYVPVYVPRYVPEYRTAAPTSDNSEWEWRHFEYPEP